MSQTEVILLHRVPHLGQMGDIVRVKPGYARNFLLPHGMALRANEQNRKRFENERAQLEAQNIRLREEAERLAERMDGLSVTIIRQAGESGNLYGSVSTRDIAQAAAEAGLTIHRKQVILAHPVKMLGLFTAQIALHPELSIPVTVNIARSEEEAERQFKNESPVNVASSEEAVLVEEVATESADQAIGESAAQ